MDSFSDTALRAALLAWYDRSGRDLPWRHRRDPYAIWVSEIMLQQTQVQTVIPYYERWLAALPTLADLAAAPEAQVLKLWEGLGYYSRARHLHRAAQIVATQHGGVFPQTFAEVLALPGIGRSTAGAILASAFGKPYPILDANVRRVLGRLVAVAVPPAQAEAQLWDLSASLIDPQRPHDFNQALMDLGATVCLPRTPRCLLCPWQSSCKARQSGEPERFPGRAPRRPPQLWRAVSLLLEREGCYLLLQRPERGLLARLWEFPLLDVPPGSDPNRLLAIPGLKLVEKLGIVEHSFTHRRLHCTVFTAHWQGQESDWPASWQNRPFAWVSPKEWQGYALPGFVRKIAALRTRHADPVQPG